MTLDDAQLASLRTFIYERTGMLFEEKKNYFIMNRVTERMRALGCADFAAYDKRLRNVAGDGEADAFIQAITINETYFFRDFPQLQGFAEKVLPPYLERKKERGSSELRVWSAACSTGEEPYTLAIILLEVLPADEEWTLSIEATDIDESVLAKARRRLYGERSVAEVPTPYKSKYFARKGEGWELKEDAAQFVDFSKANLIDREAMRTRRDLDFIFCRNVLIYFDDKSRKKVVSALYDSLAPGGYLFLGHSESIARITSAFELEKIGDFLCYRKAK